MIAIGEYQVLERSEMKRLLDEQKFQYSGCVDTKCAVDIGKMIGAKYMVVGSVSKLGNSYSIDSRMINVKTSESYISANFIHQGQVDILLTEGISSIARQLCELENNPQYIHIERRELEEKERKNENDSMEQQRIREEEKLRKQKEYEREERLIKEGKRKK